MTDQKPQDSQKNEKGPEQGGAEPNAAEHSSATPEPNAWDNAEQESAELGLGEEAPRHENPISALKAENDSLKQQVAELKDQVLRAMAEAENTRRRTQREKDEALRYAAVPLLKDLVRVTDNLARALSALPDEEQLDDKTKALRDGVAMTERELIAAFQRHGITKIDPLDQPMDPNRHEAMFEIPDEAREPGTVAQVLEPGWMLHERLIRPARVGVARKP